LRAARSRASLVLLAASLAGCAGNRTPAPGPASAAPAVRPLLAQGDRLRREGDPEAGVKAYERAVRADPSSVPAHLRYVQALSALGRRSEARRVYEERSAAPTATEAERVIAMRLRSDGSSSALRRVYGAAAAGSPSNPWWRLALAEVETAEADAWNRRRLEAIDRGDREEEKKAFAQARGAVHRADQALSDAAEAAPTLAEVDLYRGVLRSVEGDLQAGAAGRLAAYRAAVAAFLRAVSRDPDPVEAWVGLADARYRVEDYRGSLEAWLEAARRAPADGNIRMGLALVLHQVERYRESAEQYREAARLLPREPEPLQGLGDALADDERWEPALRAYEESLRRDASAVESHYKRGVVLEHLRRYAEARVAYERYVEQGGERAASVERRIERLLRAECER
jgi:tetratricopeptide (TPR) repeat protein